MKILCLIGLIVFFVTGCHRNHSSGKQGFPEYSSTVIRHFSQNISDSLKKKAACFLLNNLQDHYSNDNGKTDSEILTEAQLIKHIEHKCKQLDTCPWLTGISFENFSEYLLPYRIDNEPIIDQTEPSNPYRERFNYIITQYDDCLNSSYQLAQLLLKDPTKPQKSTVTEIIPDILHLRDLGIPASIDFLPVTNQNNLTKAWIFVPDDRLLPQNPYYMRADRIGKVYRKTFSHQSIPQASPGEYIPPFFRNPFHKDVTSSYQHTRQITLSVPAEIKARHAYLAMFNDSIWQPVAWSKIIDHKCQFDQLGAQTVYLPIYYSDSLPQSWSAPFVLETGGELRYLTGNGPSVDLTINRTRPYYSNNDRLNNYFPGSHFESANDETFTTAVNKYAIDYPHYKWGSIKLNPPHNKRYWRHCGNLKFTFNLSELQLLDTAGQVLSGKFIGPDLQNVATINDGNPDSFKSYKGWIGIDLGKPTPVSEIRYLLPLQHRIYKNHRYELLYFRDNRWQSAAILTAPGEGITFPAVQTGYLYRLFDMDRNEYSNIFTIENSKMQFR